MVALQISSEIESLYGLGRQAYPGPRGFLLILSFFIWKFATRSTDRSAESGEKESLWSRPLRISLSCWLST